MTRDRPDGLMGEYPGPMVSRHRYATGRPEGVFQQWQGMLPAREGLSDECTVYGE